MPDQSFSLALRILFVRRFLFNVGVAWLALLMLALTALPG
jgi:hypothetical protein